MQKFNIYTVIFSVTWTQFMLLVRVAVGLQLQYTGIQLHFPPFKVCYIYKLVLVSSLKVAPYCCHSNRHNTLSQVLDAPNVIQCITLVPFFSEISIGSFWGWNLLQETVGSHLKLNFSFSDVLYHRKDNSKFIDVCNMWG